MYMYLFYRTKLRENEQKTKGKGEKSRNEGKRGAFSFVCAKYGYLYPQDSPMKRTAGIFRNTGGRCC